MLGVSPTKRIHMPKKDNIPKFRFSKRVVVRGKMRIIESVLQYYDKGWKDVPVVEDELDRRILE